MVTKQRRTTLKSFLHFTGDVVKGLEVAHVHPDQVQVLVVLGQLAGIEQGENVTKRSCEKELLKFMQ